jgi:Fe-S-cluster containining protein
MIPKFNCSACGRCCSKIQGLISKQEKEFIKEYGYGKLPLVQVIPVEEMTFPLWDFEAKRFKEYQKNIDAKIRPSRGFLDLKSSKFVIVTYHMNSEACPFLKDNKCSIYNTRRAFICHLFPFNKSPFLDTDETIFGSCPNISEITKKLNYKEKNILIKQLYDSFGNTFLASIQHDFVTEWSNKIILDLIKKKMIKPAINYPYEFLIKRINNSEKVDFTDFLAEINFKTKEEIKI